MIHFTDEGTVSGTMEKDGVFDVSAENEKTIVAACSASNFYPKPVIKFLISKFKPYKVLVMRTLTVYKCVILLLNCFIFFFCKKLNSFEVIQN